LWAEVHIVGWQSYYIIPFVLRMMFRTVVSDLYDVYIVVSITTVWCRLALGYDMVGYDMVRAL